MRPARHGADLVKWGGDAVLLLFHGDDHAVRAVRAASRMRQRCATSAGAASSAGQVRLRMSVGVHSGEFHFFLVGDPEIHRELIVAGPGASRDGGRWRRSPKPARSWSAKRPLRCCRGLRRRARRRAGALMRRCGQRRRRRTTMLPRHVGRMLDVAGLLSPPLREHLLDAAG